MRLPSASIHFRSIHWVVPHVLLALAMLAAGQSGTAQTQAISLGSSSNAFGSAGVLFPTTPVGSTSAAVTIPLEVNADGTTITQISVPISQGGQQEYSVTATGCALNIALTVGTVCSVVVTFSPIYPGERTVPLQVRTSAGRFNFGLVGSGIGPEVALTPSIITTVAGNGTTGYSGDSQVATNAQIAEPVGEAFDSEGNLYFADSANNVIRKVSVNTGVITTVAGNGGAGFSGDRGPATDAQLNAPDGIALDGAGNIYIADSTNCFIRKVAAATGIITTVVGTGFFPIINRTPTVPAGYKGDGGIAATAEMNTPEGIALDSEGNIYIADTLNNVIREVNAGTGIITTVAGNHKQGYSGDGGPATSAELYYPSSVAVDKAGNLFIAEEDNHVIRKVTAGTGIIATVAGTGTPGYSGDGGPATSAEIHYPYGVALDSAGNIYVVDEGNHVIRKVAVGTDIITTVAGTGTPGYSGDGGPATSAKMHYPFGVALDSAGNIYVADALNNRIRKVNVLASELNFATTPIGFTSLDSPQTAVVSNIGNAPLLFTVPTSGLNPSVSPNFTLSNSSSCPQLDITSSLAGMASGDSCTLLLSFTPIASGPISGTANIADNALGISPLVQTVHLNAVGLPAGDAVPNFTVTATPISQTVSSGSTATYTISVTGVYDFAGQVALTATGVPAGATSSISPTNVTVAGATPATATLTIVTAPNQAQLMPAERHFPGGDSPLRYGLLLLPLPLLGVTRLRQRVRSLPLTTLLMVFGLLCLGAMATSLTGCANIGLTLKPQTSTLTVTGTSGNLQRSLNLILVSEKYVTIKY